MTRSSAFADMLAYACEGESFKPEHEDSIVTVKSIRKKFFNQ